MLARSLRAGFSVVLLLVAGVAGASEVAPLQSLEIETAGGVQRFDVELADTPETRRTGLMYRQDLPERRGMLFVFDGPEVVSFWMLNTLIPLDMLFIGRDGRIARIAENAEPGSTDFIDSDGVVIGVLEINGGLAERLGIAVGDRVRHTALVPVAEVPLVP